jgi:hypothetical protein
MKCSNKMANEQDTKRKESGTNKKEEKFSRYENAEQRRNEGTKSEAEDKKIPERKACT